MYFYIGILMWCFFIYQHTISTTFSCSSSICSIFTCSASLPDLSDFNFSSRLLFASCNRGRKSFTLPKTEFFNTQIKIFQVHKCLKICYLTDPIDVSSALAWKHKTTFHFLKLTYLIHESFEQVTQYSVKFETATYITMR